MEKENKKFITAFFGFMLILGVIVFSIAPRVEEKSSSYQHIAPNVEQFNDTLHVVTCDGQDTLKFILRF